MHPYLRAVQINHFVLFCFLSLIFLQMAKNSQVENTKKPWLDNAQNRKQASAPVFFFDQQWNLHIS